MKPKIIALSASLRNARWGKGIGDLIENIKSIDTEDGLYEFVNKEGKVHLEQFIEAGRNKNLPFDELYKNLRKFAGGKGLSNSEIGMVVALWGAYQLGCDIEYIPLSDYFKVNGKSKNLDELEDRLLTADGLLLCTPVYFGDRSSLMNDFIEFIRLSSNLKTHLTGKPMAGIAVGAKRNGGQETALIYQLLDMTSIGMLGLGNDSDTTSQYGGTIVAGDIGVGADDSYGLKTALGTGRRLARVLLQLNLGKSNTLQGKMRVMFWILQDEDDYALNHVTKLIKEASIPIDAEVMTLVDSQVGRCIACDICPISVGPDSEYRCIVTKNSDEFVNVHEKFLDHDLIVPVVFSPKNRSNLKNIYQRFIERTRYLRRGDYLFSDITVMPLVFDEVGSSENMHIRLLTSLIRHHTVMAKPNVGYVHNDILLNENEIIDNWNVTLEQARYLTLGRLAGAVKQSKISYNPIGYVLSATKDKENNVKERRSILKMDRDERHRHDADVRLAIKKNV